MRRVVPLLILLVLVVRATPAEGYEEGTELFRLQDSRINESSGISASSFRDDIFFTHNDSGDAPRFFAVDGNGCTLATYNLTGPRGDAVEAIDWEDMARGPTDDGRPALFFGDVGDNLHQRTDGISVYRVPEPRVTQRSSDDASSCPDIVEATAEHTRFDLAYEDEPHDVETLLVHPVTGQLFVVTKTYWNDTALYAAPSPLRANRVNVLSRLAAVDIPASSTIGDGPFPNAGRFATTAGDIAPDADRVVIRTYTDAWEWPILNGDLVGAFVAPPERIAVPQTSQAEAITYTRDGRSLVVSTEGANTPVHVLRG